MKTQDGKQEHGESVGIPSEDPERSPLQTLRQAQHVDSSVSGIGSASPHALDGSQYHNIIEEQVYAEQRPSPQEQRPWRIFHPTQTEPPTPEPDKPSISVGPP